MENRFKNANEAFEHYKKHIIYDGVQFDDTQALFNVGFYMDKPIDNHIIDKDRNWKLDYAEAEWQWYLSGDNSIDKLGFIYGKIPEIWKRMASDYGYVNSNYGHQWQRTCWNNVSQLDYVIDKLKNNKDTSTEQVENIISIISEIRSFKNELNVSPGSFIDMSINSINDNQKNFINSNEIILKKLGRINNILSDDLDKPAATMVVSGDLFKIYFDKDVDLKLIKENLTSKQNRIQEEMNKISQRLENKSFVDRAPKEIVEQEKTNYNNLKNDIDKISVTIKGI